MSIKNNKNKKQKTAAEAAASPAEGPSLISNLNYSCCSIFDLIGYRVGCVERATVVYVFMINGKDTHPHTQHRIDSINAFFSAKMCVVEYTLASALCLTPSLAADFRAPFTLLCAERKQKSTVPANSVSSIRR